MPELTIEDFEELNNCPMCSGLLKGDQYAGRAIKRCGVDRGHGFFVVMYYEGQNQWVVEYRYGRHGM